MTNKVLKPGWVTFAGAGPGAPDLLTVRCRDAIAEADVIVYAGSLVAPEVLAGAAFGCRLYDSAAMALPAITETLINAARQGLKVLRLHTGDPSLYGATAEQMAALDLAAIPHEMIPGVSAVFAAAAALRAELTLPEISQTLILSRRGGRTPVPEKERLEKLATHGATLALYLSVADLAAVVDDLRRGGYPPETPAAVVYRASWPDEKIVEGTLVTLADQVRQAGIDRQAVILVGAALARRGVPSSRLYDPAFGHGYRGAQDNQALPLSPLPAAVSTTFCGRVAVYALTETGCRLGLKIGAAFSWDVFPSRSHVPRPQSAGDRVFLFPPGDLSVLIEGNWHRYDGHLFIMAAGIVVRFIAPLLEDKTRDPAVVVCDEKGRHAVSLIGGHLSGANRLAAVVAGQLGGQAVLSTATDVQGLPAFDDFAAIRGMEISHPERIKALNSLLLNRRPIAWVDSANEIPQDYRACANIVAVPSLAAVPDTAEGVVFLGSAPGRAGLGRPLLHLRPLPLAVGVGCRRDTPAEKILAAIDRTLANCHLEKERVACLASIDLKADENGLLQAAAARDWPLRFFSAAELMGLPVAAPSPFVEKTTGSPSVAEAAALAAGRGRLLTTKQIEGPVTVAVGTVARLPDAAGQTGRLRVVGIGSGTRDGMTRQAVTAIRDAEIIVGYRPYCAMIAALTGGKKVVASGMREEISRCDKALDLAMAGHSVALVCSGDAGIYGMAGLVFERIEARRLNFSEVRVIPGVTAAGLAAAAVGAPLMNDFAVLSLSDLLTAKEKILRRLKHVARSGMACALYNPRSRKRHDLIVSACDLFRQERGEDTPAAVVTDAGRRGETVWTGRLAELPVEEIGMSSVVLIGGAEARLVGKWLVEPRGYGVKTDFFPDGEE